MNERRRPPSAPGAQPLVGHTLAFLRDPLGCLERCTAAGIDLSTTTQHDLSGVVAVSEPPSPSSP